jgi:hypothetical protein
VKNSHTAAFKTCGVETLLQMVDVQKYALSALNLVATDVSDSSAFSAQQNRITESKQLVLH